MYPMLLKILNLIVQMLLVQFEEDLILPYLQVLLTSTTHINTTTRCRMISVVVESCSKLVFLLLHL